MGESGFGQGIRISIYNKNCTKQDGVVVDQDKLFHLVNKTEVEVYSSQFMTIRVFMPRKKLEPSLAIF